MDDSHKVIEGKEGWLWLINDTNDSVPQATGERTFSSETLQLWAAEIQSRVAALKAMGIPYIFFIPPNKESVYPEYYPEQFTMVERRPVHHFIDSVGPHVPLCYPVDALIKARSTGNTYTKVDTHWNTFGALMAAHTFAPFIGATFPAVSDCTIERVVQSGDLGGKLNPWRVAEYVLARVTNPQSRLVFENGIMNTGYMCVYQKPGPVKTRLLVFGDSFSTMMHKFYAEAFDRYVFIHSYCIDLNIVKHENPDVVVTAMVERFLIEPPYQSAAFRFEWNITDKMAEMDSAARQAVLEKVKVYANADDKSAYYANLHLGYFQQDEQRPLLPSYMA